MLEHPPHTFDHFSVGDNEDRRRAIRFPLEMDLRYRHGVQRATWNQGQSINISSSGILIRTEDRFRKGMKIEVAINWPKMLEDRIPLQLIVLGRVVRAVRGGIAVEFKRSEFRTVSLAAREKVSSQEWA